MSNSDKLFFYKYQRMPYPFKQFKAEFVLSVIPECTNSEHYKAL